MLGITRYILRQLVLGTVLVAVSLACVLWLTQSLRFVEMIVNQGASVAVFLKLTILLIPNFLSIIVPISLFAVVLFVYNKLTMDRELVVMRAAGVSDWSLARPALLLALIATVGGYVLTLHFIPQSVLNFRELQWSVRNNLSGLVLQEGVFNQVTEGVTVFVRSRTPEGELQGILVHDKRDPAKSLTMIAQRGALLETPTGPKVLMVDGNRQEVVKGTGRLSTLFFDSYAIEFGGGPAEARVSDARERPTAELLAADELTMPPLDYRRFRVEAHQRLTLPLYNLTFVLLALAAVLTGGFSRRGIPGRVLSAVAAIVLLQASALGASNLAVRELAFAPLMYANPILPALAASWLLTVRRRRPARRRPAAAAAAA